MGRITTIEKAFFAAGLVFIGYLIALNFGYWGAL